MTSLPLWEKRRCAKSENPPTQKKVILCTVHPNNVVLNSTEFLKYPKIHEFYWVSNVQVGLLNSQSSLWFTLYDESNHRLVKSLTVKSSRRRRRSTCQINDATQPFPQSRIHERLDFVIGEFTCQRHGMSIAYVDDFTQGRSQAWAWGLKPPKRNPSPHANEFQPMKCSAPFIDKYYRMDGRWMWWLKHEGFLN